MFRRFYFFQNLQSPQRFLCITALAFCACVVSLPKPDMDSGPVTKKSVGVLKNGIAYAPASAPLAVKHAIWAGNAIQKQPYHYGGGHGHFISKSYDCSGAVSFILHYAGVLKEADDSRTLRSFGEPGPGRWITIYAHNGHAFMRVAGLRLDTTGLHGKEEGPRWRNFERSLEGYSIRHPAGL